MVMVKIGAILTFLVVGGMLVQARELTPFAPFRLRRNRLPEGHRFLHLSSISIPFPPPPGIAQSAKRICLRHHHVADSLHRALCRRGRSLLGMMSTPTFVSGPAAEPRRLRHEVSGRPPDFRLVIVIGALTAMISSLLRVSVRARRGIWYAMSRDGLLPKLFSAVHPRFKTPHISTWIACFAVGIPAGLVDIGDAADLANIGTLFAFVLVFARSQSSFAAANPIANARSESRLCRGSR